MAAAPTKPHGYPRRSYFLEECPHSSKCLGAPFLTHEDYAEHKKTHHARTLELFRWEPSRTRIGVTLESYLTLLARDGWTANLIRSPLFSNLFYQPQDPYDPLEILDCAETLLHFGLDKHSSICTIKAIVAREATFS